MADPIVNFFKSTLVGTYSNTDTSFTIATGDGAKLPDPAVDGEFNLVIYEGSAGIVAQTYEIVRVTAKSGDVLTVTREQEGTTALTIGSSLHSIIMSATKKTFDDLANISNQSLNTTDNVTFAGVTATNSLRFPVLNSEPESPSVGQLFFNTSTSELVFYDGANFQALTYTLASKITQALPAGVTVDAKAMTVKVADELLQDTNTIATALDGSLIPVGTLNLDLLVAQAQAGGLDGILEIIIPDLQVEYLVIAGGGGGGTGYNGFTGGGGGGGAGGYRSSVIGECSGRNTSAESAPILCTGTNYCVTIGAGGAGSCNWVVLTAGSCVGSNSVFNTITSSGGGNGGKIRKDSYCLLPSSGGSGGGGSASENVLQSGCGGASGQGFNGASSNVVSNGANAGGGGGGAGGNGQSGIFCSPSFVACNNGGVGICSCITGTLIGRAGGGGGSPSITNNGFDGGGNGQGGNQTTSGQTNKGGGGGGQSCFSDFSGSGGSGVVILRYPDAYTLVADVGLTTSTSTVGSNKVTCITAGTGNICFDL